MLTARPAVRRLPSLNALRAFDAAARHLSFTRAAGELCVTHGAISRQVQQLERELGVALFRRLVRRVALTPEGSALHEPVRAAFALLENGVARVGRGQARRPLVVSCIATFAMRWLIPRLHRFQARHPGIEVRLSAPNPADNVAPDDTDLAIRVTPAPCPEGMVCLPFVAEEIGPVGSPEALARAPVHRPEDLSQHPLLHTESRREAWTEWLRAVGGADLVAAGPTYETFYFLLQAAASGLGLAVGPRPLVADDIAAGRLVAPLGFVPSGRSYYALYREADAADPRVGPFAAWLAEEGVA